jgi:AmmeMemoRadiSam system protein B/AmmeMemoRadiSam system protein A
MPALPELKQQRSRSVSLIVSTRKKRYPRRELFSVPVLKLKLPPNAFGVTVFLLAGLLFATAMSNIFGKVIITPSDRRKPKFAGSWYEADARKLKLQLGEYLNKAADATKAGRCDSSFMGNVRPGSALFAGIAPHAGYMFSGPTAGFVYESLQHRKVSRVFLLGPSHYVALHGCALPVEKTFGTPLGDIAVDTKVVNELKDLPLFKLAPEIHQQEHSLEMQLPFIKQALGNVSIVPIIVGTLRDEEEMRFVGRLLKRYLTDNDIVLVSSDFTHYGPRYDYTPFDHDVPEQLKELDESAFHKLKSCDLKGFIDFREQTGDTICGFYPCTVLLSMLPPGCHASLLRYQTSRDVLQNADENSVSYMAIVFSNDSEKAVWRVDGNSELTTLSEADKQTLLKLARETLVNQVQGKKIPEPALTVAEHPVLALPAGVFVTLYKKNGKVEERCDHKELRGCIGYIWPIKSLAQAVIDNAVGAASRDPRFNPVTADEVADLEIDINVLTPPHPVASYKDIVVGRDGVILYKDGKQSVFLPSVATEFGWTLEEMLSQLSLKAGCGADGWQNGARFDVFQSTSFAEQD